MAYESAVAQLAIAEQRLKDTTLRAPFDALVVQRFAENSENVQAAQPVVRLQDITAVDIAVGFARERGRVEQGQGRRTPRDIPVCAPAALSGRVQRSLRRGRPAVIDVSGHFTLPAPEDYVVLPGMTSTIVSTPAAPVADETRFWVPTAAVFADAEGMSCVWRVSGEGDQLRVQKTASRGR